MRGLFTKVSASARSAKIWGHGGALGACLLVAMSQSPAAGPMLAAPPAPGCGISGYKAAPGLTAVPEPGGVALTWDGDRDQQVRLRLAISGGRRVRAKILANRLFAGGGGGRCNREECAVAKPHADGPPRDISAPRAGGG